MKKAYKSIMILIVCIVAPIVSSAHFGSKGPFGGSVTCSTVNDSTVYIGTAEGGVYESTNSNLVAWRARPVGLKSGKITALTHTGKYLFCGTADSGVYIFTGFVGNDRYWNKINTGLTNLQITSLVAIDSITVMAGTTGGGIFKTTNKGVSWTAVNNSVLHHYDITGLAKAVSRIIHTSDGGVWASDDDGVSWIDYNDVNTYHVHAYCISNNSTTNQIMVYNTDGLFIMDSADTKVIPAYTLVTNGLPANTIVRSISNNGTTWYIATDKGVFSSPTGTISWTAQNTNLTTMDVTTVAPIQTNLVLGTNKEGIYKSPAASIAWTPYVTNYNNLVTYAMHTSGASLSVAATEKGVFVCTNVLAGTAVYVRSNTGLTDSLNVTDLTMKGTMLYATTKNAGVFMSADTGKTWSVMNTGLLTMNIKKIVSDGTELFIISATDSVFQYVSNSWASIQAGLPSGAKPLAITFYGANVIVGCYGQGVYIKPIASGTWTTSNTGLSDLNVTSVTASPSKIYAGTDGSGVFVSDPSSVNWAATSTTTISHTTLMGLDASKIQAMAYNAGYVFASYKGGLVATSDNGATWIAGGNQFNLPSYTNVNKITFVTTRVFVITDNNCLYSNSLSELPVITGVEENVSSTIVNVFPNPSNGESVTVSLENNLKEISEVIIYDITGKLIDHLKYNSSKVQINLNYNPGLYYIVVSDGEKQYTNKLIIN